MIIHGDNSFDLEDVSLLGNNAAEPGPNWNEDDAEMYEELEQRREYNDGISGVLDNE